MSVDPSIVWRVAPFATFIGVLAARSVLGPAEESDPPAWSNWLYLLQAGAAGALLIVWWRRYQELSTVPPVGFTLLAAVASGAVVFALWVTLTEGWMRLGEPAAVFVPLDANGQLDWALIAARTVGAVLVVPVMEELFWRSFLARWVDRRDFLAHPPASISLFAWVASSAVFALAHDLWLAAFLSGLIFGGLYRWSGSLWTAVTSHAVANLLLAVWVVHNGRWEFW